MSDINKLSLTEFLHQVGAIDDQRVDELLMLDASEDVTAVLIDKKIMTPTYLKLIQQSYERIPYVNLVTCRIDHALANKIPEKIAVKWRVMLLPDEGQGYRLAMVNPMDTEALAWVGDHLQSHVTPCVVKEVEFIHELHRVYRRSRLIDDTGRRLLATDNATTAVGDVVSAKELLDALLHDAYRLNASDIHFESMDDQLRVRLRIDGVLDEQVIHHPGLGQQLFQLLKLLGDVDISESILPQDGSFEYPIDHDSVAIRLSVMPIEKGQSAVVRLLSYALEYGTIADTINDDYTLKHVLQFLQASEGMMLITGPTGSGKTTTLYTCIEQVNQADKKIITIEDPVEVVIPGINQVQIVPDYGLDFADVLKFTLRQDPDMILLGEIRDEETATMATRAAITGHTVMSTLHTNGAIAAVTRLINLGVPGFQVSNAIQLILAQRLLKRVCPHCVKDITLTAQQRVTLEASNVAAEVDATAVFKQCDGCEACQHTGTYGRIAIFETLIINEAMRSAISANDIMAFETEAKASIRGHRLIDHALKLGVDGVIPFSEVLRIQGYE